METCIYYKNGGFCGYYSDDETKEFCNMSVCSVEKTDCHKDIKLEKLIGRKVKCLFTDG